MRLGGSSDTFGPETGETVRYDPHQSAPQCMRSKETMLASRADEDNTIMNVDYGRFQSLNDDSFSFFLNILFLY